MKKYISTVIFVTLLCCIMSCSTEEYSTINNSNTYEMTFNGGINGYNDEVTSRASSVTINSGDSIYLVFYDASGNQTNYGTAAYTGSGWKVMANTALTDGNGSIAMHYFVNPKQVTSESVRGNARTAQYSGTGTWSMASNVVTINGTLSPCMFRINFKGEPGTEFKYEAEDNHYYSKVDGRTMSSGGAALKFTINESGESGYIYMTGGPSFYPITVDGNQYIRIATVMWGNHSTVDYKSYVVDLPTWDNHQGWICGNDQENESLDYGPYENGHEYVDLGLSVKWATCNVGATNPEDYGDYYAWGETETKSYYDWSTYKWCNGSETTMTKYCTSSSYGTIDNKSTLDLEDDVAHVKWGGNWRMPTDTELTELRTQCTWTWTTQDGINGYKVTGTNGNSIFLPAAGFRDGSSLYNAGSRGYYWSSSLDSGVSHAAYLLYFNNVLRRSFVRYYGYCVRAVCP